VRHGNEHKKLYDLIINTNKSQTQEMILYFFRQGGPTLPEDLGAELLELFQSLRGIYEELLKVFPTPPSTSPGRSFKLSESGKRKADDAVRRLEDWNDRFLRRAIVFVLFGRHVYPVPGEEHGGKKAEEETDNDALKRVERLRDTVHSSLEKIQLKSKQLLIQDLEIANRESIPHSSLEICQPPPQQNPAHEQEAFLAEYRIYSDDTSEREIKEQKEIVRKVASILHHADLQMMGLLHCGGFWWDFSQNRFGLRFDYPSNLSKPRTLLSVLWDSENPQLKARHPLDHRIRLAKGIASALFVLHSADLVHKQVRPDNIVIFEQSSEMDSLHHQPYPYSLGQPFLVGFDAVRKVDAASLMLHVEDWEKQIYLSPERYRLQAGDEFRMQHDIYSLGVVLLEIALWTSFQDRRSPVLKSRLLRRDGKTLLAPEELKKAYLGLASGAVARHMGQRYANVVQACLNGLDHKIRDGTLEDADGIIVGTAYITEIIKRLEEITL
jgi:hypothetical protein